jgi:hypothetical protein
MKDLKTSASVGDRIFDTLAEAEASVAAYAKSSDATPRHAYYWGAGGSVVAPTVFSDATTPRIMATMYEARRQFVEFAQRALSHVLLGALANKVLRFVYGKAKTSFGDPKPKQAPTPATSPSKPTGQAPDKAPATRPAPAPSKSPPPAPQTITGATTTDIQGLKQQGFVLDRVNRDGTTALYRHPVSGARVTVVLRRGGPAWINSAWGRNRIEAELRTRGFMLNRQTRGEGGLLYRNRTSGEEVRIMPRPNQQFRDEPIEKHLGRSYYRYRQGQDAPWGDHTAIVEKD